MNTKIRNKILALCSEEGTVPRSEVLNIHLISEMHKECVKVNHLKSLFNVEKILIMPMNKIYFCSKSPTPTKNRKAYVYSF